MQGGEPRVLTGHKGQVRGALLLPDGRRALSWAIDHTLHLWDLAQGSEPQVLARHEGTIRGALLLPGGRRVLSWSEDHTLRLFDLSLGTRIGCYVVDAAVTTVALSRDGHVAFVGDALGFVQILCIKEEQGTQTGGG